MYIYCYYCIYCRCPQPYSHKGLKHISVLKFDFLTGLKPRDSCCRSDVP